MFNVTGVGAVVQPQICFRSHAPLFLHRCRSCENRTQARRRYHRQILQAGLCKLCSQEYLRLNYHLLLRTSISSNMGNIRQVGDTSLSPAIGEATILVRRQPRKKCISDSAMWVNRRLKKASAPQQVYRQSGWHEDARPDLKFAHAHLRHQST